MSFEGWGDMVICDDAGGAKRLGMNNHRALAWQPQNRQIIEPVTFLHKRNIIFQIRPAPVTLALIRPALQLPHAVLDPTFYAGRDGATKACKEDEELQERDVDDGDENGEAEDKRKTEDVYIAVPSLSAWWIVVVMPLKTYTKSSSNRIFCALQSAFWPGVVGGMT